MEDLEDKNPEWEKEIKRVEEYLHELGALQSEGADTYMSAFSQLKSYPFFRQAAHWFYPFDRQQPDVAQVFKGKHRRREIYYQHTYGFDYVLQFGQIFFLSDLAKHTFRPAGVTCYRV